MMSRRLAILRRTRREPGGQDRLPAIAVIEQLLLVVVQLLALFDRELQVWAFDGGVDRAGFLAEAAVDALGHVDVVARGAPAAVFARLGLVTMQLTGQTASHSLQAMQRSSRLGYRRSACSPRNRKERVMRSRWSMAAAPP